jgi:hypothetical protein
MAIREEQNLLAEGRESLAAFHRPRIEQEVRARYARDLENAPALRRWRIEIRIRWEIRRSLAKVAPAAGLY